MKVIHILYELKYSGAEIMYVDAAPHFQKMGCELFVVATAPNLGEFAPRFKEVGYTVYHKPYPSLKRLFQRIIFLKKFVQFLKKEQFDVVHIHSSRTMWGFSFCARLANIKCVYTFHNVFPSSKFTYPYHFWRRWSAKRLFRCTFHTISDSVFQHELDYYHNTTHKIYNWFGNKRFYPATIEEKIEVRKTLGFTSDSLIVISVGGCSPIKRHAEIILALQLIKKQNANSIYIHLGAGHSLEEEKTLVQEMGLTDCVKFYGNQSDVRKFLIVSDIYLMPSKFEGIPITTIEAMGCGIPSILYNVPGLRDFNNEAQCCILIEEDFKKLAENVISLSVDRNLQKIVTQNATCLVNTKYHIDHNTKQIFNLYQK